MKPLIQEVNAMQYKSITTLAKQSGPGEEVNISNEDMLTWVWTLFAFCYMGEDDISECK